MVRRSTDMALLYCGGKVLAKIKVYEVSENLKSFEAVVSPEDAGKISELISKGKRFAVSYY